MWSETLLTSLKHVHLHPGKWAQKKNGFSEKSRPNSISMHTWCYLTRRHLLYTVRRNKTEHMSMADSDCSSVSSIIWPRYRWQIE